MKREKYEKKMQPKEQNLKIDLTLPGNPFSSGRKHPLTIVTDEIKEIFNRIGFKSVFGPEIDSDFYNFEASAVGVRFRVQNRGLALQIGAVSGIGIRQDQREGQDEEHTHSEECARAKLGAVTYCRYES